MSDGGNEESWDDWAPKLEDAESERFKWGCSAAEGVVVRRVSGPGDGLPSHVEQLSGAWGRELSPATGDMLGGAEYVPSRGSRPASVVIQAYYGAEIPDSVVRWFQEAFPDAQVRLVGAE